jgi:hypothetical protein
MESGTCTQGAYDEYVVGLILTSCGSLFLLVIHFFRFQVTKFLIGLSSIHFVSVLLYLYLVPKYLINTTIKGLALCQGNSDWGGFENIYGFDSLSEVSDLFEYLFAPFLALNFFILLSFAVKLSLSIYLDRKK